MHSSSHLKKEFLKKWIEGLQICCSSKKQMNLMERKKHIKLSSDIALASAKHISTSWSKALISNAKKAKEDVILVDKLLGPESQFKLQKIARQMASCHERVWSTKILKKSCSACKRAKKMRRPRSNLATFVAKKLVKKRTSVLKRLVPGGESMDEFSLVKEALDYILSLRVQVDVMRSVVNVAEVINKDKLMKSVE